MNTGRKAKKPKEASSQTGKKRTIILIDLETTGLIQKGQFPHITQIAANEIESNKTFATYVLPKLPISPKAQELTGIMVTDTGTMEVNGEEVQHVSITTAIKELCEWLIKFPDVELVAQNGKEFDFPILFKALINTNTVDLFQNSVKGFIDSLHIFRKAFPQFEKHGLEYLAEQLLGIAYDKHNAISDVEITGKLIRLTNLSPEQLLSYSFSPQEVLDKIR